MVSHASDLDGVLEVGCGTGFVLAELAARGVGKQHVGVDLADPGAHRDQLAASLDLRVYDGARLPFEDKSFDLVYATHVLEHVPNEREFLRELARVARGQIYVEVPCEVHLRTNHRDLQQTLNIGHINAYSPESFLLVLQTSGLDVGDLRLFDLTKEVQEFHGAGPMTAVKQAVRSALIGFSPLLASRLMTYHCAALCRST